MPGRIQRPLILIRSLIVAALVAATVLPAASPPSSKRSREVQSRVTPLLKASLAERQLEFGSPVFIRIFKQSKELEVWVKRGRRFEIFKTYPIHYFSGSLGPKLKEGDRQAPEGFYYVPPSRLNPNSRFHLSFNLGYPNTYDRAKGRTGSALMVHGSTVSIGCFAMTDPLIEEIYTLVEVALKRGQKFVRVHIFPFRMTDKNLRTHRSSKWFKFWSNLKQGYDHFELHGTPPDVNVSSGRYTFRETR